jgi:hypothetical protein
MARWEFILFLLIFSVDGGGCFFGCISGKLWSLVSFAFGGRSMFPCCALASGRQTLHRRRPISFRAMVAEVILSSNLGDGATDTCSKFYIRLGFGPGVLALASSSMLWSSSSGMDEVSSSAIGVFVSGGEG